MRSPFLQHTWQPQPHIGMVQTLAAQNQNELTVNVSNTSALRTDYGLNTPSPKADVLESRKQLKQELGLSHVEWLTQVHGTHTIKANGQSLQNTALESNNKTADACWTDQPLVGCAVLSADCLPVVISSGCGGKVGVAHAGWRGLAKGVVPELIQNMGIDPSKARAWLGVCIGRNSFEIGEEVRDAFQASPAFFGLSIQTAFAKITEGIGSTKLTADLKLLASIQLKGLGVKSITSTTGCTIENRDFYSYRHNPNCGRMATVVWLIPNLKVVEK